MLPIEITFLGHQLPVNLYGVYDGYDWTIDGENGELLAHLIKNDMDYEIEFCELINAELDRMKKDNELERKLSDMV